MYKINMGDRCVMWFIGIFGIIQRVYPTQWVESSMIHISQLPIIIILHKLLAILCVYTSLIDDRWATSLTPQKDTPYNSPRYSISVLLLRSSLALVRIAPHRDSLLSSLRLTFSRWLSGAGAAIFTKITEQPNFSASLLTVHVSGSSCLSCFISLMSAAVRL